jgi:hypothetical protein
MADDETQNSLIPLKDNALVDPATAGHRLIRRAISDAVVPMRNLSASLQSTLRRVGAWEFHAEDYRQLEIWALALDLGALEQVTEHIDRLYNSRRYREDGYAWLKHGKIVDLGSGFITRT